MSPKGARDGFQPPLAFGQFRARELAPALSVQNPCQATQFRKEPREGIGALLCRRPSLECGAKRRRKAALHADLKCQRTKPWMNQGASRRTVVCGWMCVRQHSPTTVTSVSPCETEKQAGEAEERRNEGGSVRAGILGRVCKHTLCSPKNVRCLEIASLEEPSRRGRFGAIVSEYDG